MKAIIDKLNEAFLPKNLECDGGACTGCWKDVIREAIRMIEEQIALQKDKEENPDAIENLHCSVCGCKEFWKD